MTQEVRHGSRSPPGPSRIRVVVTSPRTDPSSTRAIAQARKAGDPAYIVRELEAAKKHYASAMQKCICFYVQAYI